MARVSVGAVYDLRKLNFEARVQLAPLRQLKARAPALHAPRSRGRLHESSESLPVGHRLQIMLLSQNGYR